MSTDRKIHNLKAFCNKCDVPVELINLLDKIHVCLDIHKLRVENIKLKEETLRLTEENSKLKKFNQAVESAAAELNAIWLCKGLQWLS